MIFAKGSGASTVVVRCVLAGATVAAAILGAVEGYISVRDATFHPPQSRRTDVLVMRKFDVDARVVARIGLALPPGVVYDVEVDPTLGRTDRGQAFLAWLSNRLLPRVQVRGGEGAHWHVVWRRDDSACRCRLIDAGRVNKLDPPVVVFHD